MAKRRATVEIQLQKAQKDLTDYLAKLKEKQPDRAEKKDPKWRSLQASVKRFEQQMKAVERRESFRKAVSQPS